jgi:hypothetical protein
VIRSRHGEITDANALFGAPIVVTHCTAPMLMRALIVQIFDHVEFRHEPLPMAPLFGFHFAPSLCSRIASYLRVLSGLR